MPTKGIELTCVRRAALVLLAVTTLTLILGPAATLPEAQGWETTTGTRGVDAGQTFPPPAFSTEAQSRNLTNWLSQALDLNLSFRPYPSSLPYGPNITFMDGYNRTLFAQVSGADYKDATGSVLRLYYERSTHELIKLDVSLSPPLPSGNSTLREFGNVLATSLGFSLSNASYSEYTTSYPKQGSNGTDEWGQWTVATWKEMRAGFQVNFANDFQVVKDRDLSGVVSIALYRWFDALPSPTFSEGEITAAASDFANQLYGPRTFDGSTIGLAPNYHNLTWSFLVDLYSHPSWGDETYVVLLDAEALSPQRVDYRLIAASGGRPGSLAGFGPFILVAAAFVLATFLLAGWYGHFDAGWVLWVVSALVPLYARLKRESVLDHFLRGRIVEFVSANPGCTYAQLQEKFGVANGVLTYHLWVLTRTEFIQVSREGRSVSYHTSGTPERRGALLS